MSPKLPSLSSRELISLLKKKGFILERQSGSHAVFIHPNGRRTTIPIHGKRDIGKGLLHQIMKDSGISTDDLRES